MKLDIKNAQNCIARARCVDELEAVPELQHLAWHVATTLGPHTALHSGGQHWGTAQEGVTQGDPEATPLYCLAWHRYVREAEDILRPVRGLPGSSVMMGTWSALQGRPPRPSTHLRVPSREIVVSPSSPTSASSSLGLDPGRKTAVRKWRWEVSLWVAAGSRASSVWGSPSGRTALSEV